MTDSGNVKLIAKPSTSGDSGTVYLQSAPPTQTASGDSGNVLLTLVTSNPPGQVNPIPPSPGSGCEEPTGSINPFDWMKYWSCVLSQSFVGLYTQVGQLITAIAQAFSTTLIAAITGFLSDAVSLFETVGNFLKDPSAWLRAAATGLFAEASPSIVADVARGSQNVFSNLSKSLAEAFTGTDPLSDPIFGPVLKLSAKIGTEVATPTSPEGSEARIEELYKLVEPIMLSLLIMQEVLEKIPTLNQTGTIELINALLEARGIYAIARGTIQPYLDKNIGVMLNYQLNQKYANIQPDLGTQIQLYNKGYWSLGVLDLYGPQVSGMTPSLIHQVQKLTRQTPGYQDFVNYNRRHPEDAYDVNAIEDLLGLDLSRYGKVFDETRWSDIPIRTLKMAYQSGSITVADVDFAIRRQGYRDTLLQGQTKSDFQVMHDYVVGSGELPLEKAELESVQKLFLKGERTELDLRTAASKVYEDQTQLETYMRTSQNDLELSSRQPKHFSYLQLIKFAESGQQIDGILDADLAATGLDQTHQQILKEYIQGKIAAKQETSTTNTTATG